MKLDKVLFISLSRTVLLVAELLVSQMAYVANADGKRAILYHQRNLKVDNLAPKADSTDEALGTLLGLGTIPSYHNITNQTRHQTSYDLNNAGGESRESHHLRTPKTIELVASSGDSDDHETSSGETSPDTKVVQGCLPGKSGQCSPFATCTKLIGGNFACTCLPGYAGDGFACTDINECALGTDNCHIHASCTNTPGSFICTCLPGYAGDGYECIDIDECTTGKHNCHKDASCLNTPGSYNGHAEYGSLLDEEAGQTSHAKTIMARDSQDDSLMDADEAYSTGKVTNGDSTTAGIPSTDAPKSTLASALHPYLISIGVTLVFCGTTYAGLLLPIIQVLRFLNGSRENHNKPPTYYSSHKNSRYSHDHSPILQKWCASICTGIFLGFYGSGAAHYGRGKLSIGELAKWCWHLAHYWDYAPSLKPVEYAWWMTICYLMTDIIFTFIFAVIRDWPQEDLKDPPDLLKHEELHRQKLITSPTCSNEDLSAMLGHRHGPDYLDSSESSVDTTTVTRRTSNGVGHSDCIGPPHVDPDFRHGFVVVCLNDSERLAESACAVLEHIEPWQLFIVDNGSKPEEIVARDRVCRELSEDYHRTHPWYCGPPIDVSHLSKGSKILTLTDTAVETRPLSNYGDSIASSPHVDSNFRHGFLVVCHNSSDIIPTSARAILRHVEPWQLFIADNGSTPEEIAATDRVCRELSNEYQREHPWYCGPPIDAEREDSEYHGLSINCVTIMDDDVILPYNWSQTKANRELSRSKRTVAIAYPLRVENSNESVWTRFQDLEYLMGDAERATQDLLSTNLFCSGAIATWRLDIFKHVLDRHDGTFHGEDIEMGWITHRLSGRTKLEGDAGDVNPADTMHRIGLMRDCVVPTTTPIHFHHYWDYVPVAIGKRLPGGRTCSCGEASLFQQRSRSWDIANHSFFLRYIRMVFSPGGWTSWTKSFARLIVFWKVIGILREYVFVFGIFIYLGINHTTMSVLGLIAFMLDSLFIWWGLELVVLTVQNIRFRQSYLQVRPGVLVLYPAFFLFVLTTFVRPVAALYNVCYYGICVRFSKQIKEQIKEDNDLRVMLENAWNLETGTKTLHDIRAQMRDYRAANLSVGATETTDDITYDDEELWA